MENSNASTVDYSSGVEAMKKAKPHIESGYSSMDEDNFFKLEYGETAYVAGSDDDWTKPKNERKHLAGSPERKNLCGRLAVVGLHSPSRQHMSDGAASSSEMSPGANSPSRSCTQCGATKTPLWRNGPSGPKSLCNACGIRYKKVGGRRGSSSSEPHDSCHQSGKSTSKSPKRKAEAEISAPAERNGPHGHRRTRLLVREKREAEEKASCHGHMVFQQSPPVAIPRRVCTRRSLPTFHTPKWGSRSARFSAFRKSQTKDEEEGAALLMALACGLVNA